jgi:hypothetical protein
MHNSDRTTAHTAIEILFLLPGVRRLVKIEAARAFDPDHREILLSLEQSCPGMILEQLDIPPFRDIDGNCTRMRHMQAPGTHAFTDSNPTEEDQQ